jgi:recombination protein RecA
MFGKGISALSSLLDAAIKYNIIEKKGAWYYYGDETWQGRDNVRTTLETNPELAAELDAKLRAKMFPDKVQEEKPARKKAPVEEEAAPAPKVDEVKEPEPAYNAAPAAPRGRGRPPKTPSNLF